MLRSEASNYAGTRCSSGARSAARPRSCRATALEPARGFFELEFVPYRVGNDSGVSLFTGYYEPQLRGSRTRHGAYQTPLYAVPARSGERRPGPLPRESSRGRGSSGRWRMAGWFRTRPERKSRVGLAAAVRDPLRRRPDRRVLSADPGSGPVVLDDGTVVRAAYAAQNGRPYTAIGAVLIQRGELKREAVSMQSIRAWLLEHPAEAQQLMNANASYVFFEEQPIGDPSLGRQEPRACR